MKLKETERLILFFKREKPTKRFSFLPQMIRNCGIDDHDERLNVGNVFYKAFCWIRYKDVCDFKNTTIENKKFVYKLSESYSRRIVAINYVTSPFQLLSPFQPRYNSILIINPHDKTVNYKITILVKSHPRW